MGGGLGLLGFQWDGVVGEVGFYAIAAEELGEVESAVGGVEEGDGGLAGLGDGDGNTDADGLEMPGAAGVGQLDGGDCGAEVFGRGHGLRAIGVGKDDGELFATEAGGFTVGWGNAVRDDVGDLAEAVIAVDMAEEVVVLLEQVDVDHEQGEGLVGDEGAAPFVLEALVEGAAVGEAGEAVE